MSRPTPSSHPQPNPLDSMLREMGLLETPMKSAKGIGDITVGPVNFSGKSETAIIDAAKNGFKALFRSK